MTRYRTIVADPPWPHSDTGAHTGTGGKWEPHHRGRASVVPYPTMSVAGIAALPVGDLAEPAAHLYLWTFGRFIPLAYRVARRWGFQPSTLLTWCKAPMGLGFGGAYCPTTEHILFCRRGVLAHKQRWDSTWFRFTRPQDRGPAHSAKPDGFLDVVEQVSPGPYLELFARRNRLGWDTYGDEALNHVALPRPSSEPRR